MELFGSSIWRVCIIGLIWRRTVETVLDIDLRIADKCYGHGEDQQNALQRPQSFNYAGGPCRFKPHTPSHTSRARLIFLSLSLSTMPYLLLLEPFSYCF